MRRAYMWGSRDRSARAVRDDRDLPVYDVPMYVVGTNRRATAARATTPQSTPLLV